VRRCLFLILAFIPGLLGWWGCSSPLSQQGLDAVDTQVPFARVAENPSLYQGATLLVGGEILSVRNLPAGTRLVVLQQPLDASHWPRTTGSSEGRFIVVSPRFLDPEIFRPGRQVTVVGTLVETETALIDERNYLYPVLREREIHPRPTERDYWLPPNVQIGIGVGVY